MSASGVVLYERLARSGLPSADLAFLVEAVAKSSLIVGSRTKIIEECSRCDRIILILEGWACKVRTLTDGRRQLGPIHLAGDFCNLGALADVSMDFGALALTTCHVTSVSRQTLIQAMEQRPALTKLLLSMIIDENRSLSRHVVNLGRRSARERTAHLLIDLLSRLQENGEALDDSIRCAMTQTDMADYLGLSTVHTNRALKDLKDNGLVGGRGNHYKVIDRKGLQAIAQF